jgi:hypothetical protein
LRRRAWVFFGGNFPRLGENLAGDELRLANEHCPEEFALVDDSRSHASDLGRIYSPPVQHNAISSISPMGILVLSRMTKIPSYPSIIFATIFFQKLRPAAPSSRARPFVPQPCTRLN